MPLYQFEPKNSLLIPRVISLVLTDYALYRITIMKTNINRTWTEKGTFSEIILNDNDYYSSTTKNGK